MYYVFCKAEYKISGKLCESGRTDRNPSSGRGICKDAARKERSRLDFLGWLTLPTDYDKEEFARIQAAAKKIQKNSEVLVVIGIGGSYLGARAAIEFLKSPFYNNLKKDTPDIYYVGNNINPTYLNEVISICEGRDFSVNVISKSGTTTEPALAFRVFKQLVERSTARTAQRITFLQPLTRQRVR